LNIPRYVDISETEEEVDIQKTINELKELEKEKQEVEIQVINNLTRTVGIEPKSLNEREVVQTIREEIANCDATILIATTRFVTDGGVKKLFEWGHAEFAMAHQQGKPLLILKENDLILEGLPKYLMKYGNVPAISFERSNLFLIRPYLDDMMPTFREHIKNKKWDNFMAWLWDITLKFGGGVIVGAGIMGLAGYYQQSSRKLDET
jgi:hypothetical protein